ncbi:MAG: hypothetical protein ACQEWM_01640 [Actinomycetota bacterium]
MDALLMSLGSALLAVGAIAIGVVVHMIGLGRVARISALGLPGRRLRTDAAVYRTAHRAATPLTWLTCSVAAVAALGALAAGIAGGVAEWAILAVLAAVILVVGLILATWRAHASGPGEAAA